MQIKTKIRTLFPIKIQNRLLPQQSNSIVSSPLIPNKAFLEQYSKNKELKSANLRTNDNKEKEDEGRQNNRLNSHQFKLRKSESTQSIDVQSEMSYEFKEKTGFSSKDSEKGRANIYQLPQYYYVTKKQQIMDAKQSDQIELHKRYSLGSDYNQYSYNKRSQGLKKLEQFEKRVMVWQQNNSKREKELFKDRLSLSTQMDKFSTQNPKIKKVEDIPQSSAQNFLTKTNVSNSEEEIQQQKNRKSEIEKKEKIKMEEQLNLQKQKRKEIQQIVSGYESKLREKQKKAFEAEEMKQKYKNLLDKNSENLNILMSELQKVKQLNDLLTKNLVQKNENEEDLKMCMQRNREQLAGLKKEYEYEKTYHNSEINNLISKYQYEIKRLEKQAMLKREQYDIEIENRGQQVRMMKEQNIKLKQQMKVYIIKIEEHDIKTKELEQNIQSTIQAIDLLQSKLQISKRQNNLTQTKLTQSVKLYQECMEEKKNQMIDFEIQKRNIQSINKGLKCNIQQLKSINEELIIQNIKLRDMITEQSECREKDREKEEQINKNRQYIKDLENTLKVQDEKQKILTQKQKQAEQKILQLSNILTTTQQNHKQELKMLREELDIKSKDIFQKITDYYQEKDRLNQQINGYKAKIQQKQRQLNEQGYKMTEIENLIKGQQKNDTKLSAQNIQNLTYTIESMQKKMDMIEEIFNLFQKKISIEIRDILKSFGFQQNISNLIQEQASLYLDLHKETSQKGLVELLNRSYCQTKTLMDGYQSILLQNKKLKSKQSLHIPQRDKQKEIKLFTQVACSTDASIFISITPNFNPNICNELGPLLEKESFMEESQDQVIKNTSHLYKKQGKDQLDMQESNLEYLHQQLQQKQHIIEVMQGCIEDYKKMIKDMKTKLQLQEQIEHNYLQVLDFFEISIESIQPSQAHQDLFDVINNFTNKLEKMVQTINMLQNQFSKVSTQNNELLQKKRKMIHQLKKCQDMIEKACVQNQSFQVRNKQLEDRVRNHQIYIGELVKIIDTSNQQIVKSHMTILNFKWTQVIQLSNHMEGNRQNSQNSYNEIGQNLSNVEEISIQISRLKDRGNGQQTQRQIIEIDLSDIKNQENGESLFEQTMVGTIEKKQNQESKDKQQKAGQFVQGEIKCVDKIENKEIILMKLGKQIEEEKEDDSYISEEQPLQVGDWKQDKLQDQNQIKEGLLGKQVDRKEVLLDKSQEKSGQLENVSIQNTSNKSLQIIEENPCQPAAQSNQIQLQRGICQNLAGLKQPIGEKRIPLSSIDSKQPCPCQQIKNDQQLEGQAELSGVNSEARIQFRPIEKQENTQKQASPYDCQEQDTVCKGQSGKLYEEFLSSLQLQGYKQNMLFGKKQEDLKEQLLQRFHERQILQVSDSVIQNTQLNEEGIVEENERQQKEIKQDYLQKQGNKQEQGVNKTEESKSKVAGEKQYQSQIDQEPFHSIQNSEELKNEQKQDKIGVEQDKEIQLQIENIIQGIVQQCGQPQV